MAASDAVSDREVYVAISDSFVEMANWDDADNGLTFTNIAGEQLEKFNYISRAGLLVHDLDIVIGRNSITIPLLDVDQIGKYIFWRDVPGGTPAQPGSGQPDAEYTRYAGYGSIRSAYTHQTDEDTPTLTLIVRATIEGGVTKETAVVEAAE